ncbi:DUF1653 domain-containing protein [Alicyclobacillus tolerans]|uniref:DUF1653 domain-containing protein n=1 Tax=Alicyclobacillus tolerans TaxID=90970 RepID=UPI001F460A9D|nr:DUF1653 domain-containing protein [Alicyclobacillus tolerans]MCF8563366.1 DUF1653 domain-containing protein [Alicyclobacillus tolerans]
MSGKLDPRKIQSTMPYGQKFRHYKGGLYVFLYVGRHSETEEWFVVYQNAAGDIWIRPFDMFFETVSVDGKEVPRFQKI